MWSVVCDLRTAVAMKIGIKDPMIANSQLSREIRANRPDVACYSINSDTVERHNQVLLCSYHRTLTLTTKFLLDFGPLNSCQPQIPKPGDYGFIIIKRHG